MEEITTAFISLWKKRVGAVAWNSDSQTGSFEFEKKFLQNNWDVAPLKMPVADAATGRVFSFPELAGNKTFKGLPGLLADVLPDKYGNDLINAWLAQQGRPENSLNPVEMLCFIGQRAMGALEFTPASPKIGGGATVLHIDRLVQVAGEILAGRKDFHADLSANEEKALFDILKIGTSAGGARAKAVIAYNAATGAVRSGQAEAPPGYTHWLIKFDGVKDSQIAAGGGPFGTTNGYGRVEMAYHMMAIDCGIEMTTCRLLEENGRAHFMTQRFDRPHGQGKLHVQSFCAMQHYDFADIDAYSYEQLFQTMRMLRLPYTQAEQLYRRMVFNVLARNCDDHAKNFSFLMDAQGTWRLSPAYDVCHSYRPGSQWVSHQSLSVNGKRSDITHEDMLEVARQMNVKRPEAIIHKVAATVSRWQTFAAAQQVPQPLADAIGKTLLV